MKYKVVRNFYDAESMLIVETDNRSQAEDAFFDEKGIFFEQSSLAKKAPYHVTSIDFLEEDTVIKSAKSFI